MFVNAFVRNVAEKEQQRLPERRTKLQVWFHLDPEASHFEKPHMAAKRSSSQGSTSEQGK